MKNPDEQAPLTAMTSRYQKLDDWRASTPAAAEIARLTNRVAELESDLSAIASREETHLLKIHKLDAENAAMKRGTSALGWCFKTSDNIYSPTVMQHCDRPTRHRGPHSWEIDEARRHLAALVEAFAGDDRDVQRICEAARAYLRERETT